MLLVVNPCRRWKLVEIGLSQVHRVSLSVLPSRSGITARPRRGPSMPKCLRARSGSNMLRVRP